MLKPLHLCKQELYLKKVYIHDFDGRVLVDLFYRNVKVEGFVTDNVTFKKKTICNLPIFLPYEVDNDDCVVVYNDYKCAVDIKTNIYNYSLIIGLKQSLEGELNSELFEKNIYIYGKGKGACDISWELGQKGLQILGYYVSSLENGNDAIEYDMKKVKPEDALIISVKKNESVEAVLDKLDDLNSNIYTDDFQTPDRYTEYQSLLLAIDRYLKKKKGDLYLVGRKGNQMFLAEKFIRVLYISKYKEIMLERRESLECLYSFIGRSDDVVMICEVNGRFRAEIIKKLKEVGLNIENQRIFGLQNNSLSYNVLNRYNRYVKDSLVGESLKYKGSFCNGWKVLGKGKRKVLILGGSTSSYDVFWVESWPEKLYKLLRDEDFSIYVGARPGADVSEEFLRLSRDINSIKPEIVISMSGVNDIALNKSKLSNTIYEMETENGLVCKGFISDDDSSFENWKNIQRIMYHIVHGEGVRYISILQPCNFCKPDKTIHEKIKYGIGYEKNANDFRERARNSDAYVNWLNLFWNRDDMIFDECHYTNAGNKELADRIYKMIRGISW